MNKAQEKIALLYCKWCPKDCRGLTREEKIGCLAAGGFAEDGLPKLLEELGYRKPRPEIICLCGSTRFTNEMLIKQWELTKQGFIVLSWCALPESYFMGEDKTHIGDQEGVKKIVDEVHFRKIDLADKVMILNIGGYIGESTRNELNYAKKTGKTIIYLEEVDG